MNTTGEIIESDSTIQQYGYVDCQAMDHEVDLPERFEHIHIQDPFESCMLLTLLTRFLNFGKLYVMHQSLSLTHKTLCLFNELSQLNDSIA